MQNDVKNRRRRGGGQEMETERDNTQINIKLLLDTEKELYSDKRMILARGMWL